MEVVAHQRLLITDMSHVGVARRAVRELARQQQLDEVLAERAALVATEGATNLVRHAGRGEILLRPLDAGVAAGVEMLVIDRGPGMADPERNLRDGFSTAGTSGIGLGAMRRLSHVFDYYSQPGKGTVFFSRVWTAEPRSEPLAYGAVCVPKPGETACGDSWDVKLVGNHALVLLVDGLGHGPEAERAALAAKHRIRQSSDVGLDMLQSLHAALASTRGAALGLLEAELPGGPVYFSGIGNTAGMLMGSGKRRSLVSINGIAGHQMRRPQRFEVPVDQDWLLMMYTDGLSSQISLDPYPGLRNRHPAVVAAVLYRDFARGNDDATVLVARAA